MAEGLCGSARSFCPPRPLLATLDHFCCRCCCARSSRSFCSVLTTRRRVIETFAPYFSWLREGLARYCDVYMESEHASTAGRCARTWLFVSRTAQQRRAALRAGAEVLVNVALRSQAKNALHAWQNATEQVRRAESAAAVLFARQQMRMLSASFEAWASFARALAGDLGTEGFSASPRSAKVDLTPDNYIVHYNTAFCRAASSHLMQSQLELG